MGIAEIPVETVVNIAVQLWDIIGIPGLLGIVTTWLVQRVKIDPNFPLIESGKTWAIRIFVVLVGTVFQLLFHLVAGKEIGWELTQEIALTYLTASVTYTHLFKR